MDAPQWIPHDPTAPVFDGSNFAFAIETNNGWQIHTVGILVDEDSFQISNLDENGSNDCHTSWSYEDWDFVIPLNDDAKETVKGFNPPGRPADKKG